MVKVALWSTTQRLTTTKPWVRTLLSRLNTV